MYASKAAVVLSIAALLAGCGSGSGSTPAASAPAASVPASTPATSAPVTPSPTRSTPAAPTVTATHSAWGSKPVTVTHQPAVPPVPVVTAVRTAAHSGEGYDRLVLDITGPTPSYTVRYVSQVRGDPSDIAISMPGRRFLEIVLNPAQAHQNSGALTVSGVHTVNLPSMTSWAVAGDFEGYVTIALGLQDVVGFRTGELPGRIYLDVAA